MTGKSRNVVMIIVPSLSRGGTEYHLLRTLPGLDRPPRKIVVYLLQSGGTLTAELAAAGISVIQPFWPIKRHDPRLARGVKLAINAIHLFATFVRQRPYIAHFFLPLAYLIGGPIAIVLGRRLGPSIRIMSRRSLNNYQAGQPAWIGRVERHLHRYMTLITVNAKAIADQLHTEEGVPSTQIRVIYNGIEPPPAPRSENGDADRRHRRQDLLGENVDGDCLLLVSVANLIAYKGYTDLLQAMALAAPAVGQNWRLLIVGRDDGIGSDLIDLVAELGLSENVLFLGERDDIHQLLAISDLGVLASHQEGFSNSLLEYMTAGLAIVATDVGGNKEVVEHRQSGLIVPPQNPGDLAGAIVELATDPALRRRLGRSANLWAAETFSISASVTGYEALYQDAAKIQGI